jgi:DNA mismatch endonuclease (patch repair protein)
VSKQPFKKVERPDLANRARRWAIFVHGCYWHRHKGCQKATTPRSNTEFWLNKFSRNVRRDSDAAAALRKSGYSVLTLWQCEINQSGDALKQLKRLTRRH